MIADKTKALNLLCCQEIYFSTYEDCRKVTLTSCEVVPELISNQEEVDTKLILHCFHALNTHPSKKILVRSPSDTDILVILLNKLLTHQDSVYLNYGNGKKLWLSDIDLSDETKRCILVSMRLPAMIIYHHSLERAKQIVAKLLRNTQGLLAPLPHWVYLGT